MLMKGDLWIPKLSYIRCTEASGESPHIGFFLVSSRFLTSPSLLENQLGHCVLFLDPKPTKDLKILCFFLAKNCLI